MSTDEYVPSEATLLDHYEKLSLMVSRDPEIAKENRRIAEGALARVRRDAAREALDGLAETHRDVSAVGILRYRDAYYPEESP